MKLTDKEMQAIDAIITASEATTGSSTDGWWSREILMYAKDCLLTPRQFAAACGTLAQKGAVTSWDHEPGEGVIAATEAGLKAYDDALIAERCQAIDDAMLANAR